MGTNYYWQLKYQDEPLHIGKSSAGWCFSLHIIPDMGINELDDWIKLFEEPKSIIYDEYNSFIGIRCMLHVITKRKWNDRGPIAPMGYSSWAEFRVKNHAAEGPNNLWRHVYHATPGKDNGTYDLIYGDFS